jgi:hypothetical protein
MITEWNNDIGIDGKDGDNCDDAFASNSIGSMRGETRPTDSIQSVEQNKTRNKKK